MKKILICFSLILLPLYLAAAPFHIELLAEVNYFRIKHELPPLVPNETLTLMAFEFSQKMKDEETFSHDVMSEKEWMQMTNRYDVDRHTFELLVLAPERYPDAMKSFICLVNSPEHRKGLLVPDAVAFGAAFVPGVDCSYVTVYIAKEDRRNKTYE